MQYFGVLWIRIRMFLGLMDLDRLVPYEVCIWICPPDPDTSIKYNSKKNLDSYRYWLLKDFLSLKNDANVALKNTKRKKIFLVAVLKVTDENSRIRIR
jgi:hypothetical protein